MIALCAKVLAKSLQKTAITQNWSKYHHTSVILRAEWLLQKIEETRSGGGEADVARWFYSSPSVTNRESLVYFHWSLGPGNNETSHVARTRMKSTLSLSSKERSQSREISRDRRHEVQTTK